MTASSTPTPLLTGPNGDIYGSVGIDKVTYVTDLETAPLFTQARWQGYKTLSDGHRELWTNTNTPGLRITATTRKGHTTARFDVTPSYLLGRDTNVLVPNDSFVQYLAQWVWNAMGWYALVPTIDHTGMRITRIDLTRDLQLPEATNVSAFLAAVQSRRPPYSRKTSSYADSGNRLETINLGTKTRNIRVYDKNRENPAAPPGTVRWEAQVRSDHLQRKGIRTVSNASPARLQELRRELWEWSGMDQPAHYSGSPVQAFTDAIKSGQMTASAARQLAGGAVLGWNDASVRTRQRYQSIARNAGLESHVAAMSQTADTFKSTLLADYETGAVAYTEEDDGT